MLLAGQSYYEVLVGKPSILPNGPTRSRKGRLREEGGRDAAVQGKGHDPHDRCLLFQGWRIQGSPEKTNSARGRESGEGLSSERPSRGSSH